MKRNFIVFVMLGVVGVHFPATAQFSLSFSGGTGISTIPDRFENAHVAFVSSYALTSNLDLGLSVGYQHFVPTRFDNHYTNVIPLTIEARYSLASEGTRPYALLEAGIAQVDWKYVEHALFAVDVNEFAPDRPYTRRRKEWFPMVALGVGAYFPLTHHLSVDVGIRMGLVGGGALTEETFVYGDVPLSIPGLHRNADEWNYLKLVIGIKTDL